jgi:hypothetical protein
MALYNLLWDHFFNLASLKKSIEATIDEFSYNVSIIQVSKTDGFNRLLSGE